jgi:hypothetical protein
VAPILAAPQHLSVYRLHGKNSYYVNQDQMSKQSAKHRLELFRIEFKAMQSWLVKNGYTREQLPVRNFLGCWSIYLQGQEFAIKPPSRLRFFWWQVRRNHINSALQTWRFTLLNYLTAPLALAFGYPGVDRMYRWQDKTVETTKRFYRKLAGPA